MPRVWIDEELDDDPDLWGVGNAGLGLFVRSMTFCAKSRTDGWLPCEWALARVPSTKRKPDAEGQIAALLEYRWWEEMPAGEVREIEVERKNGSHLVTIGPHKQDGYYVVNFLKKNPSGAEVEATVEGKRQAGSKGGQMKAWKSAKQSASTVLSKVPSSTSSESLALNPYPLTHEEPEGSSTTKGEHPDFPAWLDHHHSVTAQSVPRLGTAHRKEVASMYAARRSEKYSAEDLCLATVGAFNDEYRKAQGHYGCISVLRPKMVHDLVEKGKRGARPPAPVHEHPASRRIREIQELRDKLRAEGEVA